MYDGMSHLTNIWCLFAGGAPGPLDLGGGLALGLVTVARVSPSLRVFAVHSAAFVLPLS